MSKNKEMRQLVETVRTWEGWRVEETKNGWMIYPADKTQRPISVHRTPSDHRALPNLISLLRRAGGKI